MTRVLLLVFIASAAFKAVTVRAEADGSITWNPDKTKDLLDVWEDILKDRPENLDAGIYLLNDVTVESRKQMLSNLESLNTRYDNSLTRVLIGFLAKLPTKIALNLLTIVGDLVEILGNITNVDEDLSEALSLFLGDLSSNIMGVREDVKRSFEKLIKVVADLIPELETIITEILTRLLNGFDLSLREEARTVVDTPFTVADNLQNGVDAKWDSFIARIPEMASLFEPVSAPLSSLAANVSGMTSQLENLRGDMPDVVTELVEKLNKDNYSLLTMTVLFNEWLNTTGENSELVSQAGLLQSKNIVMQGIGDKRSQIQEKIDNGGTNVTKTVEDINLNVSQATASIEQSIEANLKHLVTDTKSVVDGYLKTLDENELLNLPLVQCVAKFLADPKLENGLNCLQINLIREPAIIIGLLLDDVLRDIKGTVNKIVQTIIIETQETMTALNI